MKRTIIAASLVLLSLASLKADDKQARVLMQTAEAKATVQGDLKAAIALYLSAVKEAGQNRALAAQALLRAGECYQKLGDIEARNVYERLLREFGDQQETAGQARTRLASLRPSTPLSTKIVSREIITGDAVRQRVTASPDGRYISFTYPPTGDVVLRDLSTGTNRMLTNTGGWNFGYSDRPVISPDGHRVVYNMYNDVDHTLELSVASIVPGTPPAAHVVLKTPQNDGVYRAAWMPGGERLCVVRERPDRTYQIGTVAIQDGSFRGLKSLDWRNPNMLSVSPDGRFVAYDVPAGEAGSPRDIFVLAIDGSSETAVVQNPANDVNPLWSPNGTELVFLSDRTGRNSLWRMPIENGRAAGPARSLKEDVGLIGLLGTTSNGTLFYFDPGSSRANLFVGEIGAGRATPPVPATERLITNNVGSTWSRDGEFLAYYALQNSAADGPRGANVHGEVVIRTAKTGQERTVPLPTRITSRFGAGPKWFPDTRSVLVEAGDAEGPGFGFYRLSLDTGNIELIMHLPREVSSYDLSRDGAAIFYSIADHGNRVIRRDLETRRETELRNVQEGQDGSWQTGYEAVALAASPDGTQLAVTLIGGAIQVMPAVGGPVRELFRPTEADPGTGALRQSLTWTPDQRFVLFARGDGTLWKVPASGGEAEKVEISMNGIKSPAVHPDGNRIVFSSIAEAIPPKVFALDNLLPPQSRGK